MRKAFRSKFTGTCASCGQAIGKGQRITGVPGAWSHEACAAEQKQRTLINEGYTFAAQKPSGYRRTPRKPGKR